MKVRFMTLFLSAVVLLAGCDEETSQNPSEITVPNQKHLVQSFYADENVGKNDVSFKTNGAWTSEIIVPAKTKSTRATASWLSITPSGGDKAGDYTVKISLATNYTGKKRTAAINIKCNDQTVAITVTQDAITQNGEKPEISQPVSLIKLSPEKISLQPSDKIGLKAAVYPEDATVKDLNWVSSNPQIAVVDDFGVVTAIAEGTARIVVSSVAFPDITASCIVTVIKKNTPDATLPSHYVKGINGVEMIFDTETAHVIGNKTELFAEQYNIVGGTLGGGGLLKSMKGHGRDMRFPTEHEYSYEDGYLKQMNYMIGTMDDYDTVIGETAFTWENGRLTLIRQTDNKSTGAILVEFEYSNLKQPEGNLDINLYSGLRDNQMLGPHYYVIFDNNLGKRSDNLISRVKINKENDATYAGSYERTFRYVFYNELVKEIYYMETKNGITKNETKLCDFYYR